MKSLIEILSEIEKSSFPNYVYILHKPDGTPFYVGKGGWHRISAHEKEAKSDREWFGCNPFKLNTIRKIWREGGEVGYTIDSWHYDGEGANKREIELIAGIGRRHKKEGPLTNLTLGGEGAIDLPNEIREKISESLKNLYNNNPHLREAISFRNVQRYTEHPEIKKQISSSCVNYCKENPGFIENLQDKKNEWIENNPEEYAEVERRRLEICNSEEVRQQVSETLKEYFNENPHLLNEMSERAKKWFEETPGAKEQARQNSIENNTAQYLIRWMQDNPEGLIQRNKQHSEFMTQWHASEEGKAITKEIAEKRKEQFQTEEHRKHMAEKTREFIKNNPEADKARREKTKAAKQPAIDARQKVLKELQDELFEKGLIRKKCEYVTPATVYNWKKRGIVVDV